MESKTSRFLLGLGLGSALGMIAYHCSRTDKAKELKEKVRSAMHSAAEQAGRWMTDNQHKDEVKAEV